MLASVGINDCRGSGRGQEGMFKVDLGMSVVIAVQIGFFAVTDFVDSPNAPQLCTEHLRLPRSKHVHLQGPEYQQQQQTGEHLSWSIKHAGMGFWGPAEEKFKLPADAVTKDTTHCFC